MTVFISCDKEVSTSPEEDPIPQGKVKILSTPDNFQIHMDGKFTGMYTPDSLIFIDEGEHEILLRKKYWRDTVFAVNAQTETFPNYDIKFLQNPKMYGSFEITSEPAEAEVFLNDSLLLNKTPMVVDKLVPGVYDITLSYPKHRDLSFEIVVESNKHKKFTQSLRDTSIWVNFVSENSALDDNNILSVAVDSGGYVYAGTEKSGLYIIKGSSWSNANIDNSPLISNRINCLGVDEENKVWIGTTNGLYVMQNMAITNVYNSSNSELTTSSINNIDIKGNIVLVGTSFGFAVINNNSLDYYSVNNSSLPRRNIQALKYENQNRIWLATDSLIYIFDGINNFNLVENEPNQRSIFYNTNAVDFEFDIYDNLWIIFNVQEVRDIENNSREWITLKAGYAFNESDNWITRQIGSENTTLRSIMIDKENNKWIASNFGLLKFEGESTNYSVYNVGNSGLTGNNINQIVVDQNGTYWIATTSGLTKYKSSLDL
jgi:ligand-binding sensor domain-containing protein